MTDRTAWYWGLSLTDGAFLSVEEPTDVIYWEHIPSGVGPGQTLHLDNISDVHHPTAKLAIDLKYETHLRGAA